MGGLLIKNKKNENQHIKIQKPDSLERKCSTCDLVFDHEINRLGYRNHKEDCSKIAHQKNSLERMLRDIRESNVELEHEEKRIDHMMESHHYRSTIPTAHAENKPFYKKTFMSTSTSHTNNTTNTNISSNSNSINPFQNVITEKININNNQNNAGKKSISVKDTVQHHKAFKED